MRRMLVLIALACTTVGCDHRVEVTTSQDLAAGTATHIEIHTNGGDVSVSPGASGVVHVEEDRQALTAADARALVVTAEVVGDLVRIDWEGIPGDQVVSLRITMPPAWPATLDTGGGDVRIDGLTGGVEVSTGGGDVDAEDVSGALHAVTGGGSMTVTRHQGTLTLHSGGGDLRVDGSLQGANTVETESGSIEVSIPADSRLDVDAESVSGSAEDEFGLAIHGAPGTGTFQGALGDGHDGSLELRTGAGAIELRKSP